MHITFGIVFAFDVIPLPLGTLSRILWVSGNRIYESLLGSRERARVHSFKVLLIALIPWLGYGAYLLPLRRESPLVARLYADHLSYVLYDASFEEFLAAKPRLLRGLAGRFVPSISGRAAERKPAEQDSA